MNKKNITLICAGVIIQVLELTVTIGSARIDIFSDIIGYIMMLIGIMPLIHRNNIFAKSKKQAIIGLIIAILVQSLNLFDFGPLASDLDTLTKGLTTIISIYFTYYFSESIMLEAKMQDKLALTRNFRTTWAVFGIFIFARYIALVANSYFDNISMLAIIMQPIILICGIYYSSTILTACTQLYTDEMPKLGK